ncbi:MAG: SpoIIE family protein phosphatase [Nitrospirae bacterium]|nr:SpoIIE family protein phosphatase [Nitrospirota bacterium]
MLKNRGITFKLIFLLLTGSTVIFALIFMYNYELTKKIILRNAEANAKHIATITVNKIEGILKLVERANHNIVYFIERTPYTKADIDETLRYIMENNNEIFGAALAFEPRTIDKGLHYFAPYYYRRGDTLKFKALGSENDNYFYQDWYQIPMELGSPLWSEPYYDSDGPDIIMSTYSVPFRSSAPGQHTGKPFIGVMATDVDLNWLHETLSSVKMYKTGYAFLISRNGTIVTHPDKELIMNESIFSIAEARADKNLRAIAKAMVRGETGFKQIEGFGLGKGQKSWIFYVPLKSEGWALGLIVPDEELLADITSLHKKVIALVFAGVALLSILIASISVSITRPLRRLVAATKDIAIGNLDIEIPPAKTKDEIGELTNSFVYMKTALKEYIRELTEATRAKEHIDSELKIAHEIQMSFLHKLFPPFPDRVEFDLFATIMPAKEVGGDFYDFFFIDEAHLCFIIADVSGKGVPASLFMAMTKTLIKAQTAVGLSPDEILFNVNRNLAKENNVNMFVTIFYGILNTDTGEVEFANGGHNPPLLYKKDTAELIPLETGGIVVGILEDGITFDKGTVTMAEGDFILMYTDGVTEAINERDEEFGEERLMRLLRDNHDKTIRALVELINEEVAEFSGTQPQFDDITLMVLKYETIDN